MQASALTPTQYSLWLDSHDERGAWENIEAAVGDAQDDPFGGFVRRLAETLGSAGSAQTGQT